MKQVKNVSSLYKKVAGHIIHFLFWFRYEVAKYRESNSTKNKYQLKYDSLRLNTIKITPPIFLGGVY